MGGVSRRRAARALGLAVLTAAVAVAALGAPATAETSPGHKAATKRGCHGVPRFTAYYAGSVFRHLNATYAELDCYHEPGLPRDGSVSFGYGSCRATDDAGCPLPLEVQ